MSSAIFSLPELYVYYKNWVSRNPQTASDLETSVKWISYFVAGRINNSQILSELIYSLSNLLVLFNDRVITKSQNLELALPQDSLKVWLSVLEYSEVFFELSAARLWGTKGKWLIIVCIQVFKCLSRMSLIFHYKENVIERPPIPVLQRKTMEMAAYNGTSIINSESTEFNSLSFTLQNSGLVIRKVESSPPINFRNWKPPERGACDKNIVEQTLVNKQVFAESLYIVKPVVHLLSAACFGNNTWKPWMISLVLDLYSLHLYRTCKRIDINCMTKKQKLQMARRTVDLVLYLLRSPFYEQHSRNRLNSVLEYMNNKLPLVNLICNPLMLYLPFWQRTYFYMWST